MKQIFLMSPSAVREEFLQSCFEEAGWAFRAFRDSREALETLDHSRYAVDAVLVDEQSAPLNAFQVIRHICAARNHSSPRIILLCAEKSPAVRFWGESSGADLILSLDEDALRGLPTLLQEVADEAPEQVPRPAPEAASPEELLPRMIERSDHELYRMAVNDSLREAGVHMPSLETTAHKILETLFFRVALSLGVFILKYQRQLLVYALPAADVFRKETQEFIDLCLEDFLQRPEAEGMRDPVITILGLDSRDDFEKTRLDGLRMSSYQAEDLYGTSSGDFFGTFHAGSLHNNFFTGKNSPVISEYARSASLTLHNALMFRHTEETRERIEQIFSKFVPQEVIHELLGHSDDAELQLGEKRHLAILFSDIRSFTDISEHNSAEQIVNFLNRYFDEMSKAIRHHGGFIDKFIGDAILAVFGAPVSYKDNALRAVKAALDMDDALAEVETAGLNLPEEGFNIGIGIHEGQVIVGNIGSRDKFDYTVIGDNVNLASRLEGLTKHYHQRIIVSDVLARSLGDEFFLRQVDTVKVKGKTKTTTLYAVHREPELPEEALGQYRKGLQMEKLGNWHLAQEFFGSVLKNHPDDYLSDLHRQRCLEYGKNPPEDWDGALKLDFK